jgi:DNA processing protein
LKAKLKNEWSAAFNRVYLRSKIGYGWNMSQDSAFVAWVALSLVPRVGGKLMRRLLEHFETPAAILAASPAELRAVPGVGPRTAELIKAVDLDDTAANVARWQADGIQLLTLNGHGYPLMLRALEDAPPLLFKRGPWPNATLQTAAIVGTRSPSRSAAVFAQTLGEGLAAAGWTVVSGLAVGIDACAHQGALRSGKTLAVLGCGLNQVYPPENRQLAEQICAQGALFAEVSPEAGPSSSQLVARNRLISGMSRAVILIEAGLTSGALHTTRFAGGQARPIFVADFEAEGNELLKRDGAGVITPDRAGIDALLERLLRLHVDD